MTPAERPLAKGTALHVSTTLMVFRLALALVPLLPRNVLVPAVLAIADRLARRESAANRFHRRNVARAAGLSETDRRVRDLARKAVRVQALNYLDLFRYRVLSAYAVQRGVQIAGREHLDDALKLGRGAILVSAHLGSPDRAGLVLSAAGYPCAALVEPLEPPALLDLVSGIRSRYGAAIVPLDARAPARCGGLLQHGCLLGVAADWDIAGNGVVVPFLGHRLKMPAGAALLAIRNRAPVVPIRGLRVGTDRFWIELDPPVEVERAGPIERRIQLTSERIAAVLERQVQSAPDQWVNFHDIWAENGPAG